MTANMDYNCYQGRGEVAICAPGVSYFPMYWFSRYPARVAPIWNIVKVFDPISWILIFLSILFLSIFFLFRPELELGILGFELLLRKLFSLPLGKN